MLAHACACLACSLGSCRQRARQAQHLAIRHSGSRGGAKYHGGARGLCKTLVGRSREESAEEERQRGREKCPCRQGEVGSSDRDNHHCLRDYKYFPSDAWLRASGETSRREFKPGVQLDTGMPKLPKSSVAAPTWRQLKAHAQLVSVVSTECMAGSAVVFGLGHSKSRDAVANSSAGASLSTASWLALCKD